MRDGVPGYHDPRYDPVWAVCEELDMPLNTHGGGGGRDKTIYGQDPATAQVLAFYDGGYFGRRHLPFFVYGAVLERFPGLKLVFTEQLSNWVPVELTKLDGHFREMFYTAGVRSRLGMTPLEYWQRNCFVGATFMSRAEAAVRDSIGVHNIMWGSDYPHPEGTNPNTIESLRFSFAAVPERELRPMLGATAAKVYGLDIDRLREAAERVGPSVETIAEPLAYPPAGYHGFAFRSF
jgi:predicted TIM-barrel fold metal-dependent hydrolase